MTAESVSRRYVAAMVLAGVGDALGYNKGRWEFNLSGPQIHKEVKKLGGLAKIKVRSMWMNQFWVDYIHPYCGSRTYTHRNLI